ncbi:polyprenol phosphomannose-dependent alpha 1,6 mannosyltransferase MptB [Kocuria sp. JC486]|uniref:polyprenol phosphomannose-dependent alpha 1,6 mannosyltransferase MptB n=1 Tax=Kocuria sp. JC486 TaxID=1970736 RepID=UPI0032B01ED7
MTADSSETGVSASADTTTEGVGPAAQQRLRKSPLRTVIAGAVGSILLFIGSLGVGWLAAVSEIRQNPVVIALRFTTPGAIVSIILVALGGMLLVREWLRLGQKLNHWGPDTRKWVNAAMISWSLPMMAAIPMFSRDIYSYIGQGRVMQSGLNPYEYGVSTIENFFQLGADQLWSESPPPYGPLFLWMEQGVVAITGAQPDESVLLFRGLCILSVAAIAWMVPRLARLHGINETRALWLSVANPLLLVNFILAAHNDAIMIALALGGTLAAATWRDWRGGLLGAFLVTMSIAIKPITLVFLPFIGLLWAGKGASWTRRFAIWALTLAWSVGILALMGFVSDFGFGWVSAMSTPGSVFIWYAPVGMLGLIANGVAGILGGDGGKAMDLVHSLGQMLAVPVILYMMFVGRDQKIIRRLTWAFAAIVIFAPMIQAWYVVWLIPLFAVTGIRSDWQVDVLFFLSAFFMIYAVSDQLDVFPYLDIDLSSGRTIAAVIAIAYGAYLWFLDPATRRLFRGKYRSTLQSTVI